MTQFATESLCSSYFKVEKYKFNKLRNTELRYLASAMHIDFDVTSVRLDKIFRHRISELDKIFVAI